MTRYGIIRIARKFVKYEITSETFRKGEGFITRIKLLLKIYNTYDFIHAKQVIGFLPRIRIDR